jgi:hypothetical protein
VAVPALSIHAAASRITDKVTTMIESDISGLDLELAGLVAHLAGLVAQMATAMTDNDRQAVELLQRTLRYFELLERRYAAIDERLDGLQHLIQSRHPWEGAHDH